MTTPAWKTLPTWFAVAQHDEVIPPDAERQFAQRMGATTIEVDSSHVVMISHPDDVTALIQSAVDADLQPRRIGPRRSGVPGLWGRGEKVGEQLSDALRLVVVDPVRGVGQALDAVELGTSSWSGSARSEPRY